MLLTMVPLGRLPLATSLVQLGVPTGQEGHIPPGGAAKEPRSAIPAARVRRLTPPALTTENTILASSPEPPVKNPLLLWPSFTFTTDNLKAPAPLNELGLRKGLSKTVPVDVS